jgi:hypothetical protein
VVGVPLVGAAAVALASRDEGLYRLLVKEDAILEWGQVLAYCAVVVIAAATLRGHWRQGDVSAAVVIAGLALVSLLAIGEELSWGQRIVGFATPDIAAGNRQGELTLHNDASLEEPARLALLLGAVYGMSAPLVTRRRTSPSSRSWSPTSRTACCFLSTRRMSKRSSANGPRRVLPRLYAFGVPASA